MVQHRLSSRFREPHRFCVCPTVIWGPGGQDVHFEVKMLFFARISLYRLHVQQYDKTQYVCTLRAAFARCSYLRR